MKYPPNTSHLELQTFIKKSKVHDFVSIKLKINAYVPITNEAARMYKPL